jgi:ubiquinone/menaquinone biosynthesis C-methylase UbiE
MGLPARIFATLLKFSPPSFQNRMWKWWYQRLAKAHDREDFRFMNYGYTDNDNSKLITSDEPYRLFIQLYDMNIRNIKLNQKDVLEVGSGRGGGADWIARTTQPSSLIGLDFSKDAVSLSNNWYKEQKNLTFIEGNAEDLPFDPSSFDVVYNVESSHCYGNISRFVNEVYRVLRDDGDFCWTDFRDSKIMITTEQIFIDAGFKIISKREITKEVIEALDLMNDDKKKRINELVPKSVRRSFETFAGVQGTPVYDAFKNNKLHYFHYQMKK